MSWGGGLLVGFSIRVARRGYITCFTCQSYVICPRLFPCHRTLPSATLGGFVIWRASLQNSRSKREIILWEGGASGRSPLGQTWDVRSNLGARTENVNQVPSPIYVVRCIWSFKDKTSLKGVECKAPEIRIIFFILFGGWADLGNKNPS